MRSGANRPRHDQIAELTRGLQLPLPAIDPEHLEIIAEGLLRAFNEVRVQAPTTIASGSEAEVTALLEARLNAFIDRDPLWGQLVLCVARGKESLSFDGTHLEKRPDLSIYLTSRTRRFPLITEAKILDATAAKTQTEYCDQGLRRFVEGEYAWGNREAFMIAYVRDGSSVNAKLTPFLLGGMTQNPPKYLVEELPAPVAAGSADLACSRHGRNFIYQPDAELPGPITVWRLWLS
jgi:hypothetical protein